MMALTLSRDVPESGLSAVAGRPEGRVATRGRMRSRALPQAVGRCVHQVANVFETGEHLQK
jgi:hypothetical protein